MIYMDADNFNECRDACRQGQSLLQLAEKLRIEAVDLAQLLGLPAHQQTGAEEPDLSFDLWASAALDAVL